VVLLSGSKQMKTDDRSRTLHSGPVKDIVLPRLSPEVEQIPAAFRAWAGPRPVGEHRINHNTKAQAASSEGHDGGAKPRRWIRTAASRESMNEGRLEDAQAVVGSGQSTRLGRLHYVPFQSLSQLYTTPPAGFEQYRPITDDCCWRALHRPPLKALPRRCDELALRG